MIKKTLKKGFKKWNLFLDKLPSIEKQATLTSILTSCVLFLLYIVKDIKDDVVVPCLHDHSQLSVVYDIEGIWKCTALLPLRIIFGEHRNTEHNPLENPLHWNSMSFVKSGILHVTSHGSFLAAWTHGSNSTRVATPP